MGPESKTCSLEGVFETDRWTGKEREWLRARNRPGPFLSTASSPHGVLPEPRPGPEMAQVPHHRLSPGLGPVLALIPDHRLALTLSTY